MNLLVKGIEISINERQVAEIVRQHLQASVPMVNRNFFIPAIGQEWPGQGGIYAGVARGRDGKQDYHLIVGPEFDITKTWDDAMRWASEVGVDGHSDFSLPTRKEQSLLFANVSELFKDTYYWSNEQHASNSNSAWHQLFENGYQSYWGKGNGHRARAVRRLAI